MLWLIKSRQLSCIKMIEEIVTGIILKYSNVWKLFKRGNKRNKLWKIGCVDSIPKLIINKFIPSGCIDRRNWSYTAKQCVSKP